MSIITISRGSHSGAKAVAEAVADRLGVPCISREIIVAAAESAGIPVGTLTETLDRPPSWFERMSRERETYLVFVRTALHRHAAQGSFVYHGHDGHLLLDLPNVLRVRVVAPMGYRVAAVRDALGLHDRDAERHIATIDKHRAKWTKFLYGVTWDDPLLYDLIVNLERVDVAGAVGLIAKAAGEPKFAWTDALRAEAADRALVHEVWAELAKVPETRNAELEVRAAGGVVTLRGSARDDELRRLVTETAQRAGAAREVRCEVSIPADLLRG